MDYNDLSAGYDSNFFWFKAKNNLIKILVSKTYKNKKGAKILVIGVGTGDELNVLNEFGSSYVIDKNERALAMIDNDLCVEKKTADACCLPYSDGYFDIAVSLDVFEHIENDRLAVEEINRVLKNGGTLLFTVPAFPQVMSSHDKALRHLRRYDKKQLDHIFSVFKEKKYYYWNSIFFLPISLLRMAKKNSAGAVDRLNLPRWINDFCYHLLSLDNFLIKKEHPLPIGLTIAGYCFKKDENSR